jgi:general stress protein 26
LEEYFEMMKDDHRKNKERFKDRDLLRQTIIKHLDGHQGGTLATVREDGWPQASGISYVNDGLTLYFAMDPGSDKKKNVDRNPNVGFATFKDYHRWDRTRAIQLYGRCVPVTDKDEEAKIQQLMVEKWPWVVSYAEVMEWAEKVGPIPYYKIIPKGIAYLDYPRFGFNQYVMLEMESAT